MEFIGRIYCFFESLFGQQLGEYLWGYNCETGDYTNPALFSRIALWTLSISLVIGVLYYYIINSSRFHRWWSWLIMLFSNSLLCFFFAYWWIIEDFKNNLIGDCLLYQRDEAGTIIESYITDSRFWGFNLANAIISLFLFFMLSMLLKWRSVNCRKSPF